VHPVVQLPHVAVNPGNVFELQQRRNSIEHVAVHGPTVPLHAGSHVHHPLFVLVRFHHDCFLSSPPHGEEVPLETSSARPLTLLMESKRRLPSFSPVGRWFESVRTRGYDGEVAHPGTSLGGRPR